MSEFAPPSRSMELPTLEDVKARMGEFRSALNTNLIGGGAASLADDVVDTFFSGNHYLAEGVPGVAKTETARNLAAALGGAIAIASIEDGAETPDVRIFGRAQGVPDRQPADVIGTEIYDESTGEFRVRKGPLFANVVLLDELNRFRTNVQASINEAGSEGNITIGDQTFLLPKPYFMMGTQNPNAIGQGTYNESDALIDRFAISSFTDMPSAEERLQAMTNRDAQSDKRPVRQVMCVEDVPAYTEAISRNIGFDTNVLKYGAKMLDLVFQAAMQDRTANIKAPGFRVGNALVDVAKARAARAGDGIVSREIIDGLLIPALRHRVEFVGQDPEGKLEQIVEDQKKAATIGLGFTK